VPKVSCLWPGETVAVLATGPSLSVQDVARLRGQVRVVAVNDAITLAPWADVLYSSDARWWRRYQGVPDYLGPKFSIGRSRGRADAIPGLPEVQVLLHTGMDGLEREATGLRSGEHSGYAAINLAVHLGARRILLLGYDLGTPAQGLSHFFGSHPPGLPETTAVQYARFRDHYRGLAVELMALGIEVWNCTLTTRLPYFQLGSLDHCLEAVCQ